jgi:hypothetical protein
MGYDASSSPEMQCTSRVSRSSLATRIGALSLGRETEIEAQRGSNADPTGGRDLLDCRSLRGSLAWSGNLGLLR